jgi:hypothetical protein
MLPAQSLSAISWKLWIKRGRELARRAKRTAGMVPTLLGVGLLHEHGCAARASANRRAF